MIASLIGDLARWVENGLGMLFSVLVTTVLGTGILAQAIGERAINSSGAIPMWIILGAVWTVLDLPYLIGLFAALFRLDRHLIRAAVDRQWMFPKPIRPLVSAWWLLHFSFGLLFAADLSVGRSITNSLTEDLFRFAVAASVGFVANGYLLLAIAAMTRSRRVRDWTWHFRLVIDAGLGLVSIAVAALPAVIHR